MSKKISQRPPGPQDHSASTRAEARATSEKKGKKKVATQTIVDSAFAAIGSSVREFAKDTEDTAHRLAKSARVFGHTIRTELRKPESNLAQAFEQGLSDAAVAMTPRPDFMELADEAEDHLESLRSKAATNPKLKPIVEMAEAQYEGILGAGLTTAIWDYQHDPDAAVQSRAQHHAMDFSDSLYRHRPIETNLDNLLLAYKSVGRDIAKIRQTVQRNNGIIDGTLKPTAEPGLVTGFPTVFSTQKAIDTPFANSWEELATSFAVNAVSSARISNTYFEPLLKETEDRVVGVVEGAHKGSPPFTHDASLGYLHKRIGNTDKALQILTQAREIFRGFKGNANTQELADEINVLTDLADLHPNDDTIAKDMLGEARGLIDWLGETQPDVAVMQRMENMNALLPIQQREHARALAAGNGTDPLAIARYHRAIDDDYQAVIDTAMQSKVTTQQMSTIVQGRILEFAASQFEARLDAAMAQRLGGDKEEAEETYSNAVIQFRKLQHFYEAAAEPYFLKKALGHMYWANATYTFKTGDVEQSLADLKTLTTDYADTDSGQILKYAPESMWVRQYGIVDDQGQLSSEIGKPSQVAKWKKIADKLLDDKASATKAMMAGAGVAIVGAAAADTVFGTHIIGADTLGGLTLGKIGLIGAGAGLATERGYQVLAAQREISAAYTTGIANVTAEELESRGKALATEVGICFLAGGAARYVRMGVMALGSELEAPVLRGLLSESGYVAEGAAFHEFAGALHGHTERTPLAYFKSFMTLRTLGAVNESNVASLLFPGEAWAEGVMRHGVHSALANIPLQAMETAISGRLSEYGQGYFDSLFDLYAISVGSTVPESIMHAPTILARAKATHQIRSAQNLLTRMEQLAKVEYNLQSDLQYAEKPKERVTLTQKIMETMQARAAALEKLAALGLEDVDHAQAYRQGIERFAQRTEGVRGKTAKQSLMRYAKIAALGPAIILTGAPGPMGGGRKKSPTRISPPLQYYKPKATDGPDVETAPIQFKNQELDDYPVEISSFSGNNHSLSGFGFGILKNAKGTISGGGLVYCTRVFMLDRKSGIAVDSHLPMETNELPEFVEQFDDLLAHLSDIGMDLANTEVQVFYGVSTRPLSGDLQAEGLKIADAIRSKGLKVTTISSALDDAEMSVSLEDGSFVAATDGDPDQIQEVSNKLSALLDRLKKPGTMESVALKILDTINNQLPQRFRLSMNQATADIIAQLKKIDSLAYFIPDWQIGDFEKSLELSPSPHIKKVSAPKPTAPKTDLPLPPPLSPIGATPWVESVIRQMAESIRVFLTPRRMSIDEAADRVTSRIIAHNRSPIPEVQSLLSTGEIPSGEPSLSAQRYFSSTHDAMERLHTILHTTAAIDVEAAFNQVTDGLQLSRHDEAAILNTITHIAKGRIRTGTYMNKVDETIREKLAERLGTQGHYTDLDIEVARRDILADILAKAYGTPVPKLAGHLSISAQGGMLVLRPDSLEDFKALNQTARDESDDVETLPGGFFSVPKSIDIPIAVIGPGETSTLEVYRHELQHQLKHASNEMEPGELTWPHILVALADKSVNLVGPNGKPDSAMVDRFLNFQRNRFWIMAKDEVLAYLIDGTTPNDLIDHLTEEDGFYDYVKFDEQKTTTALANHFGIDGVQKVFKSSDRFNAWVAKLHDRMRRVHNTGVTERVHALYDVLEHLIDHGYSPDAARHTLVLALSLVPFELWTGYLPKLQERLLKKPAPQDTPLAEPDLARHFDLRRTWATTVPKSHETIDIRLRSYISDHRERITQALHELESPITLQRLQALRQEFRTQTSRLQDLVDVLQSQRNDTETSVQVLKRRLKTHNTPELRKRIRLLEQQVAVQSTTLYRARKAIALIGLVDLQHTLDNRLAATSAQETTVGAAAYSIGLLGTGALSGIDFAHPWGLSLNPSQANVGAIALVGALMLAGATAYQKRGAIREAVQDRFYQLQSYFAASFKGNDHVIGSAQYRSALQTQFGFGGNTAVIKTLTAEEGAIDRQMHLANKRAKTVEDHQRAEADGHLARNQARSRALLKLIDSNPALLSVLHRAYPDLSDTHGPITASEFNGALVIHVAEDSDFAALHLAIRKTPLPSTDTAHGFTSVIPQLGLPVIVMSSRLSRPIPGFVRGSRVEQNNWLGLRHEHQHLNKYFSNPFEPGLDTTRALDLIDPNGQIDDAAVERFTTMYLDHYGIFAKDETLAYFAQIMPATQTAQMLTEIPTYDAIAFARGPLTRWIHDNAQTRRTSHTFSDDAALQRWSDTILAQLKTRYNATVTANVALLSEVLLDLVTHGYHPEAARQLLIDKSAHIPYAEWAKRLPQLRRELLEQPVPEALTRAPASLGEPHARLRRWVDTELIAGGKDLTAFSGTSAEWDALVEVLQSMVNESIDLGQVATRRIPKDPANAPRAQQQFDAANVALKRCFALLAQAEKLREAHQVKEELPGLPAPLPPVTAVHYGGPVFVEDIIREAVQGVHAYFARRLTQKVETQAKAIVAEYAAQGKAPWDHLNAINANQKLRVATARIILAEGERHDFFKIMNHFKELRITHGADRMALAKIAVTRFGTYISDYIEDFEIENEADRVVIAKIAASQDGESTSQGIKHYKVRDASNLIAIAKIAAAQNPIGTSRNIDHYLLANNSIATAEIAKIAILSGNPDVANYINHYEITDNDVLFELAKLYVAITDNSYPAVLKLFNIKGIQDFELMILNFHRDPNALSVDSADLQEGLPIWRASYKNRLGVELPPFEVQRQDVLRVLRGTTCYSLNPAQLQHAIGLNPAQFSRYILSEATGLNTDFLEGRTPSPNFLGDLYELSIRISGGFPFLKALAPLHFSNDLMANRTDAQQILEFLHRVNRLKSVYGTHASDMWPNVLDMIPSEITPQNIRGLIATLDQTFLTLFRKNFKIAEGAPITVRDIEALESQWGDLDVFYTLASRYHGSSNWRDELPLFGKVTQATLSGKFLDAKYNGFAGDAEDISAAKKQTAMLKTAAARTGWRANYARTDIYRSGGNTPIETPETLLGKSKTLLHDQVMGHIFYRPEDAIQDLEYRHAVDVIKSALAVKAKPETINAHKANLPALTRALFEFLDEATDLKHYQERLSLIRGNLGTLRLPQQIDADLRALDAATRYAEKVDDAIIFTTTTDDPKLLMMVGDLVDTSSCQSFRSGSHIETLLGYVVDANVKAMLSYALKAKDFKTPQDYARAKALIASGVQPEFIAAKQQLKIGDMVVQLPKAYRRHIVKLGATPNGGAGLFMERAYFQNHPAEALMQQQIAAVRDQLAKATGAVTNKPLNIPASRNPGGVYSDAFGGKASGAYSITRVKGEPDLPEMPPPRPAAAEGTTGVKSGGAKAPTLEPLPGALPKRAVTDITSARFHEIAKTYFPEPSAVRDHILSNLHVYERNLDLEHQKRAAEITREAKLHPSGFAEVQEAWLQGHAGITTEQYNQALHDYRGQLHQAMRVARQEIYATWPVDTVNGVYRNIMSALGRNVRLLPKDSHAILDTITYALRTRARTKAYMSLVQTQLETRLAALKGGGKKLTPLEIDAMRNRIMMDILGQGYGLKLPDTHGSITISDHDGLLVVRPNTIDDYHAIAQAVFKDNASAEDLPGGFVSFHSALGIPMVSIKPEDSRKKDTPTSALRATYDHELQHQWNHIIDNRAEATVAWNDYAKRLASGEDAFDQERYLMFQRNRHFSDARDEALAYLVGGTAMHKTIGYLTAPDGAYNYMKKAESANRAQLSKLLGVGSELDARLTQLNHHMSETHNAGVKENVSMMYEVVDALITHGYHPETARLTITDALMSVPFEMWPTYLPKLRTELLAKTPNTHPPAPRSQNDPYAKLRQRVEQEVLPEREGLAALDRIIDAQEAEYSAAMRELSNPAVSTERLKALRATWCQPDVPAQHLIDVLSQLTEEAHSHFDVTKYRSTRAPNKVPMTLETAGAAIHESKRRFELLKHAVERFKTSHLHKLQVAIESRLFFGGAAQPPHQAAYDITTADFVDILARHFRDDNAQTDDIIDHLVTAEAEIDKRFHDAAARKDPAQYLIRTRVRTDAYLKLMNVRVQSTLRSQFGANATFTELDIEATLNPIITGILNDAFSGPPIPTLKGRIEITDRDGILVLRPENLDDFSAIRAVISKKLEEKQNLPFGFFNFKSALGIPIIVISPDCSEEAWVILRHELEHHIKSASNRFERGNLPPLADHLVKDGQINAAGQTRYMNGMRDYLFTHAKDETFAHLKNTRPPQGVVADLTAVGGLYDFIATIKEEIAKRIASSMQDTTIAEKHRGPITTDDYILTRIDTMRERHNRGITQNIWLLYDAVETLVDRGYHPEAARQTLIHELTPVPYANWPTMLPQIITRLARLPARKLLPESFDPEDHHFRLRRWVDDSNPTVADVQALVDRNTAALQKTKDELTQSVSVERLYQLRKDWRHQVSEPQQLLEVLHLMLGELECRKEVMQRRGNNLPEIIRLTEKLDHIKELIATARRFGHDPKLNLMAVQAGIDRRLLVHSAHFQDVALRSAREVVDGLPSLPPPLAPADEGAPGANGGMDVNAVGEPNGGRKGKPLKLTDAEIKESSAYQLLKQHNVSEADALKILQRLRLPLAECHDILTRIQKAAGQDAGGTFANLADAVTELHRWLSPEETRDALLNLAEASKENTRNVYAGIRHSFETLHNAGFTPQETIALFIKIAHSIKHPHQSNAIQNTASAAYSLKTIGVPINEIGDILLHILNKSDIDAGNAFCSLCSAIDGFRIYGIPESKITAKDICNLLLAITNEATTQTHFVFEKLPLALLALSMNTISGPDAITMLLAIAKNAKKETHMAFVHLQTAFAEFRAAGLTSAETVSALITLSNATGTGAGLAYYGLTPFLAEFHGTDLTPHETRDTVLRIADILGKNAKVAYYAPPALPQTGAKTILSHYFRLLKTVTGYNSECVLELFAEATESWERTMTPDAYVVAVDLVATTFERHPRIGFNVLEGLQEAGEAHLLPQVVDETFPKERYLTFIARTQGFNPTLFQDYLHRGDVVFAELDAHAQRVMHDKMTIKDMEAIVTAHGAEYLLAIIQRASPTSGASFVRKSEQIGLLQQMMAAGDLHGHIPDVWKNHLEQFEISQGGYLVREGEKADPEGKIVALLARFRAETGADGQPQKTPLAAVTAAVTQLIACTTAKTRAEALENLRTVLYHHAGENDALREKIDRIQDADYTTLELLEQIFTDKDTLTSVLAEAMKEIPDAAFVQKTRPMQNDISALVSALKKAWAKYGSGTVDKRVMIASMLRVYDPAEVETRLLQDGKVATQLGTELAQAIRNNRRDAPTLDRKDVVDRVLAEPLQLIRSEKAKYDYNDAGTMKVGVRAVKGPAFGLNGLTSGVCTATDIALWKNPKFKLLAITDEGSTQVVGYVHAFEVTIGGKKYLTLPGINPSAEFLGTVKAKDFYPKLMEQIAAFAAACGYDAVLIPTDKNIHSNRGDISTEIKRMSYEVRTLTQDVNWNTQPQPYPFKEVFVAWEKGKPGPHTKKAEPPKPTGPAIDLPALPPPLKPVDEGALDARDAEGGLVVEQMQFAPDLRPLAHWALQGVRTFLNKPFRSPTAAKIDDWLASAQRMLSGTARLPRPQQTEPPVQLTDDEIRASVLYRHFLFDAQGRPRDRDFLTFGVETPEKVLSFIRAFKLPPDVIHEALKQNKKWAATLFPLALSSLHNAGFTPREALDLLNAIAAKSGDAPMWDSYAQLSAAVLALSGVGLSTQEIRDYVLRIVEKTGATSGTVFNLLPRILENHMGGNSLPKEALDYLVAIPDKDDNKKFMFEGPHVTGGYIAVYWSLLELPREGVMDHLHHHERVMATLTDYNRERALELWCHTTNAWAKDMPTKVYKSYLELVSTTFERYPRLSLNILEGIAEAIENKTLSKKTAPDHNKILHFIERAHNFNTELYRAYIKEGEPFFNRIAQEAQRILSDEMGIADLQRIAKQQGMDYLLSLIQVASPTSGASFVKKSEQIGLLKKMMEAGDLRGHIPDVWRKQIAQFKLERGGYLVRVGEKIDPEGKIVGLLHQFRSETSEDKTSSLADVTTAITRMIACTTAKTRAEALENLRATLYRYTGEQDALREKIDRIQDTDYTTLELLEQLFSDKDTLTQVLAEAMKEIPDAAFVRQTQPMQTDISALVRGLKKAWNAEGRSGGDKRVMIASMLRVYDPAEVDRRLLQDPHVTERLGSDLVQVIRDNRRDAPELDRKDVVDRVLAAPLQLIRSEKAKYDYKDTGTLTVGVRAVKGPAFGLHGLTSGVCIAPDVKLWKNPNFKLLAITDEGSTQVVGYVHAFEVTIGGKKYLTLPGINPSAEFLGTVKAKDFYPKLMEQIAAFAAACGYDAVLIPTDKNIHSNRGDISTEIKRAGYETRTLDEAVQWNTQPTPYPFKEVFVAWEKGKPGPHAKKVEPPKPTGPALDLPGLPPPLEDAPAGDGKPVALRMVIGPDLKAIYDTAREAWQRRFPPTDQFVIGISGVGRRTTLKLPIAHSARQSVLKKWIRNTIFTKDLERESILQQAKDGSVDTSPAYLKTRQTLNHLITAIDVTVRKYQDQLRSPSIMGLTKGQYPPEVNVAERAALYQQWHKDTNAFIDIAISMDELAQEAEQRVVDAGPKATETMRDIAAVRRYIAIRIADTCATPEWQEIEGHLKADRDKFAIMTQAGRDVFDLNTTPPPDPYKPEEMTSQAAEDLAVILRAQFASPTTTEAIASLILFDKLVRAHKLRNTTIMLAAHDVADLLVNGSFPADSPDHPLYFAHRILGLSMPTGGFTPEELVERWTNETADAFARHAMEAPPPHVTHPQDGELGFDDTRAHESRTDVTHVPKNLPEGGAIGGGVLFIAALLPGWIETGKKVAGAIKGYLAGSRRALPPTVPKARAPLSRPLVILPTEHNTSPTTISGLVGLEGIAYRWRDGSIEIRDERTTGLTVVITDGHSRTSLPRGTWYAIDYGEALEVGDKTFTIVKSLPKPTPAPARPKSITPPAVRTSSLPEPLRDASNDMREHLSPFVDAIMGHQEAALAALDESTRELERMEEGTAPTQHQVTATWTRKTHSGYKTYTNPDSGITVALDVRDVNHRWQQNFENGVQKLLPNGVDPNFPATTGGKYFIPLMNGWYWGGDFLRDANEDKASPWQGRIFLSVDSDYDATHDMPKAAILYSVLAKMTHELRKKNIRIAFKTTGKRSGRSDAAVIYFQAKDEKTIHDWMVRVSRLGIMRDRLPLFVAPLTDARGNILPGIGFAQHPSDGNSFGMRRLGSLNPVRHQLAQEARAGVQRSREEIEGILAATLVGRGVDPEAPAFEAGGRELFPHLLHHMRFSREGEAPTQVLSSMPPPLPEQPSVDEDMRALLDLMAAVTRKVTPPKP